MASPNEEGGEITPSLLLVSLNRGAASDTS